MPNLLINMTGCHAAELASYIDHQIDECRQALLEPDNSECHVTFLTREIDRWTLEQQALLNHFYGRSTPQGDNQ